MSRARHRIITRLHLFGERILILVIHSQRAAQELDTIEIIHRQNGTPLVLVLDKAEALFIGKDQDQFHRDISRI